MLSKLETWYKQWKLKRLAKKKYKRPKRCIDPVMKYCQVCQWGYCHYPEDCETWQDTIGCTFESGCTLGLENTKPTKRELRKFNKEDKKRQKLYKAKRSPYE